jgi:hypothetical protein
MMDAWRHGICSRSAKRKSLCAGDAASSLSLSSSLFLTQLELSLDLTYYSAALSLSLSNCLSLTFRVSGRISFVEHVV